ncbi:hypothetical protein [Streptomyces sp. NPDC055509]
MLISAERESARTEAEDVRAALDEILSDHDRLTRRLLGVPGAEDSGDTEEWQGDDFE